MAIRAVGTTIILKEVKLLKKTKGGILLTTSESDEKTKPYEVVSIGPDVRKNYSEFVNEGDIVLVEKYAGNRVSLSNTESYVTVVPSQILCKIEGAELDI